MKRIASVISHTLEWLSHVFGVEKRSYSNSTRFWRVVKELRSKEEHEGKRRWSQKNTSLTACRLLTFLVKKSFLLSQRNLRRLGIKLGIPRQRAVVTRWLQSKGAQRVVPQQCRLSQVRLAGQLGTKRLSDVNYWEISINYFRKPPHWTRELPWALCQANTSISAPTFGESSSTRVVVFTSPIYMYW